MSGRDVAVRTTGAVPASPRRGSVAQDAVRAARAGWLERTGQTLPAAVEGRLAGTVTRLVRDGAAPETVIEAAGGLCFMGQAYAEVYRATHGEAPLPRHTMTATFGALELMAHGRQWANVRAALERSAERRIHLDLAYTDVTGGRSGGADRQSPTVSLLAWAAAEQARRDAAAEQARR